jgi:PAS domain S-box-containing protein
MLRAVADFPLIAPLALLAGLALLSLRRRNPGATMLWLTAWVSLFASGVARESVGHPVLTPFLAHALGAVFPALTLAGALAFAERALPVWLLPGALLLAGGRGLLVVLGLVPIETSLSVVFDPLVTLAAAWVVFDATRSASPGLVQRLVAPFLVLVAGIDGLSAGFETRTGGLSVAVLLGWLAIGIPTLCFQFLAVGDRVQDALRRARDGLERRVEERTAELRESEERFRRLAAISVEGILIHDRGSILEVNDALAAMFGRKPEDLIGTWMVDQIAAVDRDRVRDLVDSGFQGTYEMIAVRADGTSFPVEVEAREVMFHRRLVRVCTTRDLTERKKVEEEQRTLEIHMQEMQKLESLGVLAGGVAHDFNNLLTVILGNAKLILDDLEPGSPMRGRTERIHSAGLYASGLVDQMLTYSGRSSIEIESLDLSRLVVEMLDLLRASVSEKCALTTALAPDLPPIAGDATQMRQVVMNLVTNASAALSDGGGHVVVRTGVMHAGGDLLAGSFGAQDLPEGEYVYLAVEDDGVGIGTAVQARMFEPFYTTKVAGRGLGLASVLGIVRSHGGAISVDSAPGRGSTICVLLPPTTTAAGRVGEDPRRTASGAAEGTRVLVVDDEDAVLELAREFLERSGHRVLTALGGREGLSVFRARAAEIDAVLLDLAMPDADGAEVFAAMQQIRPEIPVILASGYSEEMAADRFDVPPNAAFLRKPYTPESLVAAIRAAVEASVPTRS